MRPNPRWQQQGGRGQGEYELTACVHSKMYTLMYGMFELHLIVFGLLLSPSGGFQGMPSSLRQPGPRASLRHMAPNSGTQGPRGEFTRHVVVDRSSSRVKILLRIARNTSAQNPVTKLVMSALRYCACAHA